MTSCSTNHRAAPIQRLADAAIDGLRHVHVLRAAEFAVAQCTAVGVAVQATTLAPLQSFCDFAALDQDRVRDLAQRRQDLAEVSAGQAERLRAFVAHCSARPHRHPAVVRRLKEISDAALGERASADEALHYIRRAARKLHPDKTSDLNGWSLPGIAYARDLPAGYRYEHARHGAAALFALHQALRALYANPRTAAQLRSPAAMHGGTLTLGQLAHDLVFLGAALAVVAARRRSLAQPAALGLAGAYGALAAAYLAQSLLAWTQKRRPVTCRQLVLYRPKGAAR